MRPKLKKSRLILGFHNSNFRGPGIVASNLIAGLNKLSFPWINAATGETNNRDAFKESDTHTMLGILQAVGVPDQVQIDLLGPNTFVMPREAAKLIKQSKALVVPSEWCKEKYLHYDKNIIGDKEIYVWPVGLDTELYKPKEKTKPDSMADLKALVYYKNRPEEDLEQAIGLLHNFGIRDNNITVLKYGSFTKKQLIDTCNDCHFAVLVAHTESQGLANLEMLSMGLPMLVFDQKEWIYLENKSVVWETATSVPYFDETCGKKVATFLGENYGEFFKNVLESKYKPRKYIEENFSLERRAEQYLEMIYKSSKNN